MEDVIIMFDWIFGSKTKKLEEETKKGFSAVRDDMDKIGKWLKHLKGEDKQLGEMVSGLKDQMSTVKEQINIKYQVTKNENSEMRFMRT